MTFKKRSSTPRSVEKNKLNERELQRLKELLEAGVPMARAAAALGRMPGAVRREARKLGSAYLGMQEAKERRQMQRAEVNKLGRETTLEERLQYARYADCCSQLAKVIFDNQSRSILREMALHWIKFAEEATEQSE